MIVWSPEYYPVLILQALLALFLTAIYGIIFGPPLRRIGAIIVVSLAGVALGQLIGLGLTTASPTIGDLHLFESAIIGVIALLFARRIRVC